MRYLGELQFQLLVAIFWENVYEPCSFGRCSAPPAPIGVPLPKPPPQPEHLGCDKQRTPHWEFEVNVRNVNATSEKLPPPGFVAGAGPALGKVRLGCGVDDIYKVMR